MTTTPVGPELLVNTATAGFQGLQQITALSNGGFVVTWSDSSQGVGGATGDNSISAVKAQVFAANGTRVGSELLVNTATESTQQNPQITALSNGGFVVTWEDSSAGVGGAAGDSSARAVKAQVFPTDPLFHYMVVGWTEGRDPSAGFDTLGYLAANPDVAAAGMNPLDHFLRFGIYEGRQAVNDGLFN